MISMPFLSHIVKIILNHTQGKHDVDVSFRHIFCKHPPASQTKRHVNDVVQNELYLFYFLELPFFKSFLFNLFNSIQFLPVCK